MNKAYNVPRPELLPFLPDGAQRVLDVGCGGGGFGRTMLAARPGLELWGVEPEPSAVSAARDSGYKHVSEGYFPDVDDLPTDHFDVIFFNDVLEHMVDPSMALKGARRHLAAGGCLVASVPNVRHVSVWWPLIRRGRWDYADFGLLDRTHLRFFTSATLTEFFAADSWDVQRLVGINRAWVLLGRQDTRPIRALSRLTGGRSNDMLFAQFVVVAKMAKEKVD